MALAALSLISSMMNSETIFAIQRLDMVLSTIPSSLRILRFLADLIRCLTFLFVELLLGPYVESVLSPLEIHFMLAYKDYDFTPLLNNMNEIYIKVTTNPELSNKSSLLSIIQ
jgi:hypothetical protein